MVNIALLIMVKDEAKRLSVTLNSVIGVVNMVIVYDTGSTDGTIDIINEFCETNHMTLHLKRGEFEDYATSRNVALDYARGVPGYDYLLLMDANDELRGIEVLKNIVEQEKDSPRVAYFLHQHLERNGTIISFFNVRLLKRACDWKYVGSIHETFESLSERLHLIGKLPEVILYQDREKDLKKSIARYPRDLELLLKDHTKDPSNSRTVFYLAQTYDSMENFDQAYRSHKLRTMMGGSSEERFISTFRTAFLTRDHDEAVMWYLKAYALQSRAEPLLKICEHYCRANQLALAYHFAKLSCELQDPVDSFQYVDRRAYDYTRWAQLAATAFPLQHFEEGLAGALQAYNYTGAEYDQQVLQKYQQVLGIEDI